MDARVKAEERDDLLVRLDERTENIETNIGKIEGHQKEQNGRLGALEKWQQRIIGAAVLLGLMSPLFIVDVREAVADLLR